MVARRRGLGGRQPLGSEEETMTDSIERRKFLGMVAAAGITAELSAGQARARAVAANETVVVGVIGTGGRGTAHSKSFANLAGVEVAYVCDVDQNRADQAAKVVDKAAGKTAKPIQDFRRGDVRRRHHEDAVAAVFRPRAGYTLHGSVRHFEQCPPDDEPVSVGAVARAESDYIGKGHGAVLAV